MKLQLKHMKGSKKIMKKSPRGHSDLSLRNLLSIIVIPKESTTIFITKIHTRSKKIEVDQFVTWRQFIKA